MYRNPVSSHFWQAVGASAAALAALVALSAYLWPDASASGATSSPVADGSASLSASHSTSLSTVPSNAALPNPSPRTSQAATVIAQTTLRVSDQDGSGVDVGSLPLTVGTDATSFWAYSGQILAGGLGSLVIAEWTGSDAPTADGCANLLRTQPTKALGNHQGLRFCAEGLTTQRIAAGEVLSYDGTVSEIHVTVWDEQLS